jgi:hypothetical protein
MLIGGIALGPTEVQISRLDPASSRLPEAILAFAGTAIWGFLALVALIVFREPIARFLSTVGGRLSKISVAGIELELAKTPSAQLSSDAASFGSMDSQQLASDSYSQTLKNALQGRPVPHSYAIIDLGTGKSWLISRLFIFAVMLRLVRDVRCFVFVSGSGSPRQYLGTIAVEDIRWTLARLYPWLERIFAKAYKDQLWQPPSPPTPAKPITTQGFGMLDKDLAAVVAHEYVLLLKDNWKGESAFPNVTAEANYSTFLPEMPADFWVQVGTSKEYGAWIDADLFLRDFDGVILTERILQRTSNEEKVRKVVGLTAPYLAVVGDSGEFISLIERCKVLEEVARCPSGQG